MLSNVTFATMDFYCMLCNCSGTIFTPTTRINYNWSDAAPPPSLSFTAYNPVLLVTL